MRARLCCLAKESLYQRCEYLQAKRLLCSVRSRSSPMVVLTVSAIKPTFGLAGDEGPNVSYSMCCIPSRHQH